VKATLLYGWKTGKRTKNTENRLQAYISSKVAKNNNKRRTTEQVKGRSGNGLAIHLGKRMKKIEHCFGLELPR
jgi:hypothetical protein